MNADEIILFLAISGRYYYQLLKSYSCRARVRAPFGVASKVLVWTCSRRDLLELVYLDKIQECCRNRFEKALGRTTMDSTNCYGCSTLSAFALPLPILKNIVLLSPHHSHKGQL